MKGRILVADNLELLLTEKTDWKAFGNNKVDYASGPKQLSTYLPAMRENTYGLFVFDPVTLFEPFGGMESKLPLINRILTELNPATAVIYTVDKNQEARITPLTKTRDGGVLTKPYDVQFLKRQFGF